MTYRIAIANEKGGVAKTTTTLSLGGALAEAGAKTVLVDLDPLANLTLALGVRPKQVKRSMARVLMHSDHPNDTTSQTAIPNLALIPSNTEIGLAERFLATRQNYESVLRNAMNGWDSFDFVLFDCPPALGAVTINALSAAHTLIIPTQAEYFSVYALKNMMDTVRSARGEFNASLTYRILVTMLDRRNRVHRILLEMLGITFGYGLFQTVIEMDTKLRETPAAGVPITTYSTRSRGADQYRALSRELLEYTEMVNQQTAPAAE